MSKNRRGQVMCDDCAGFDIECMHHCKKHGADYCRGCSCPGCDEENCEDIDEVFFDRDMEFGEKS